MWSVATPDRSAHAQQGMAAARFTCRVIRLCEKHGVPWTVENPNSSGLWKWGPFAPLRASVRVPRLSLIHI
eukprot:6071614-Heterocapsa_arctica.AAC.1